MPLTVDSLNNGDCFVFDCGRKIFVWLGKESNANERFNVSLLIVKFFWWVLLWSKHNILDVFTRILKNSGNSLPSWQDFACKGFHFGGEAVLYASAAVRELVRSGLVANFLAVFACKRMQWRLCIHQKLLTHEFHQLYRLFCFIVWYTKKHVILKYVIFN